MRGNPAPPGADRDNLGSAMLNDSAVGVIGPRPGPSLLLLCPTALMTVVSYLLEAANAEQELADVLRASPFAIADYVQTGPLQEKLVKIVAKVVTHAKYVMVQLAEVAVPRQVFLSPMSSSGKHCPKTSKKVVQEVPPS